MDALLAVAVFVNLTLAVFLLGMSGFIFGVLPTIGWSVALVSCFAFPIFGVLAQRRGWTGLGALIAWVPSLVALLFVFAAVVRIGGHP